MESFHSMDITHKNFFQIHNMIVAVDRLDIEFCYLVETEYACKNVFGV